MGAEPSASAAPDGRCMDRVLETAKFLWRQPAQLRMGPLGVVVGPPGREFRPGLA